MSRYDYEEGRLIELEGYPFYGLIHAAMRKADSDNVVLLRNAFPEVWDELQARYNAPGGRLPGDPDYYGVGSTDADHKKEQK